MTADDYDLAEAALVCANGVMSTALRMLRDECGWELKRGVEALNRIKIMQDERKKT
jgi:hypothetical protein